MNALRFIGISVASLLLAIGAWAATTVNILFVNHIQMKLPEQDVFIENPTDATQVIRVESDRAIKPEILKKMVYATGTATAHDPFKVGTTPLGPFERGKSLGFTLEAWLSASGSGTYTVDGDKIDLNIAFTKLVPNGVYTVWCSRLTLPPNVAVVDKPCGAADGSKNMFTSDGSGNGTIHIVLSQPLEQSSKETVTAIALAYHSNGKTYGGSPGDFGVNSHVQLAYLFPAREEAPIPTKAAGGVAGYSNMRWLALAGVVLIVAVWFVVKKPLTGQEEEQKETES